MRLKKHYTSREVVGLTGLTARELQSWDARRLFKPAVAPHRTEAGGFTERRYSPLDVLELQMLADLRRRGFAIPRLRRLLGALRDVFSVRLYEVIGGGGPMTLFIGGDRLYVKMEDGRMFDLDRPTQPLLMAGEDLPMRPLAARQRKRRTTGSERLSRSRRPAAE
ncbi:MAG: MerR family transcriptional regulator [Acidobacteria bacterium]|nr:MerR family transcriptional regulator [Acidobacteriota bacterium]